MSFIDTSIIVDINRKFSPAVVWFESLTSPLKVSSIAWLELIDGSLNADEQRDVTKLLKKFEIDFPTDTDHQWAMEAHARLHLRYGMDPFDALIAAPCARLQVPLYTRNLKHFAPLAIQPY